MNHLFYYTEVSGGSTSATITGDFIGDLALNFALQKTLEADDNYYKFRQQPEYEEIKNFGFYCSVGKPLRTSRTENYIRNTLFNNDGFIDVNSIQKSGKSPFKNFRQTQGIAIGSEFIALLISHKKIELPPSIRVGTTKETLIRISEVNISEGENDFWFNAFTLQVVFNNLVKATNILINENKVNFHYILENYTLMKKISYQNAQEIFKDIY